MCWTIAFMLPVLVLMANAKDSTGKIVDKLADNFFERALSALSVQHEGLDSTMVRKPGHLTLTPCGSARFARSHPQSSSTFSGFAAPWVGYQSQIREAVGRASSQGEGKDSSTSSKLLTNTNRRNVLAGLTAGSVLRPSEKVQAVQGYVAGRIPGIAPSDVPGFMLYTRPEGKQGGHGVGWSEIAPYTFLIPKGWKETPVSIADPGGTELDLRFMSDQSESEGDLAVVVAPVLRFTDVGYNADVRIDDLGSPGKMLSGFGTEITGGPIEPDMVQKTSVRKTDGVTYYDYHLVGPSRGKLKFDNLLVSMGAAKNRVYVMTVRPTNSNQWEEHQDDFHRIADSFRIGLSRPDESSAGPASPSNEGGPSDSPAPYQPPPCTNPKYCS